MRFDASSACAASAAARLLLVMCLSLPRDSAGGTLLSQQVQKALLAPFDEPYPEPPPNSLELCALRGFACDRHEVDTADGYRLAVIHVLGRLRGGPPKVRPPVLVQHGMFMSSDTMLLRPDDGNLPLVLSDAGYDVWIGNYRANGVSPAIHRSLSPSTFAFWNYSFHEMGLYDLPAMMDLVLEHTGQPSLHYIGHSMGSTGMLVLLSSRPEYNAKVRLASFIAPVGYVSRLRSRLFKQLSHIAPDIKKFLMRRKIWNVFPRSPIIHRIANIFCTRKTPILKDTTCNSILFEIAGKSPEHALPDFTALSTAYFPSGTSIRIMEHYYEIARTGKFRPLGKGTRDPNPGAEYNMSAVTAPIALYYAQNDLLVYPPDVEHLARDLPNVVSRRLISNPTFNHLDFLFASDIQRQLYDWMLPTMASVWSHRYSV